MVTEIEMFESAELTLFEFRLRGWMKSEVYKIKVDTADELLASISVAAGCIKEREDQLRRTTRDLQTRVAKCTEVGGGILGEHLLWTVTDLLLNILNAELNRICHLLALLGVHHILHVGRIRVNIKSKINSELFSFFMTIHSALSR